ncbi:MAG: peptide chain release factor N(5)-glutamine methyltransferase [Bacteroidota bacterium]|nr:peptide chain release factor N(5)-glutamine methyltransferase [Bacteroidota bacterium]
MQECLSYFRKRLQEVYPSEEIEAMIRIIAKDVLGLSGVQYLLKRNDPIPEEKQKEIIAIADRLFQGEPLQYILGTTEFYGLTFHVEPGCLIPRPETEELVDLILKENTSESLTIVDIGTGSGCIAVSLAYNKPQSKVFAFDISDKALQIARQNATTNDTQVEFRKIDILTWDTIQMGEKFDIIVSNPPYISQSEIELMNRNVIDHEPHLALFVPNEDPLLFYRKIAEFAANYLTPHGRLYFEIHEDRGSEMQVLLTSLNFKDIRILKDINGKQRMAACELN